MKHSSIILTFVIIVFLSSCTVTSNYYQICDVETEQECVRDSINFIFEDDNCKVIYYFWTNGGNPGFIFFNKTNERIYLNKEESFFIINNLAQDYYKNRTYKNTSNYSTQSTTGINYFKYTSQNKTSTVGTTQISGNSVSYEEPKVICVPPMSAKTIEEYSIMDSPHRDCDIFRFPREEELSTEEFSSETSPIKFSNLFSYKIGKDGEYIDIEHNFYISRIENMNENKILKSQYKTHCGERNNYPAKVITKVTAYGFYIKYTKPSSYYKH
jgi:hypothetical protein